MKKILLLGPVILVFGSCGILPIRKDAMNPPPPELEAVPAGPVTAPSHIDLPIQVSLGSALEQAEGLVPRSRGVANYNEAFGTGGPDRPSCGIGCGYEIYRSPLGFEFSGNTISTRIDLSYHLACRIRWPLCGPLITLSCGENGEPHRRASVRFATTISIGDDWTESVRTRNEGVTPKDNCQVGPFGMVDMTGKVMGGFNGAFDALARQMDAGIHGQIRLRGRVEEAWRTLNEPIALGANAWLSFCPRAASLTAPQFRDRTLLASAGFEFMPRIVLGDKPPASNLPLPPRVDRPLGNTFQIIAPVDIGYREMERQLRTAFRIGRGGLRYPPVGKKFLRVEGVEVYGYGTLLVLRVDFSGSARGWAYFTGKPRFDDTRHILEVTDLEYTVESRNLALKVLDWIKHEDFKAELQNRLRVDVSDRVADFRARLDKALNSHSGSLTLSGKTRDLSFSTFETAANRDWARIYVRISGNASMSL